MRPIESLYTVSTRVVSDTCALVTVAIARARQGRRPSWGHPQQHDLEETGHVPLCAAEHDERRGLGADENGRTWNCVSPRICPWSR